MELLERHTELGEMEAAVRRARQGSGSVVLVSGEAGIGKTTLLAEFTGRIADIARVFFGTCEALLTPRVLGPFRDMARTLGRELLGADRDGLIDALLDQMSIASRPAVVVVEDAHWADDASLDVVRYLARRVERLPAVLVVSYRDDELVDDHPLRRVVGAVVGPAVVHLELGGLSDEAVRRCAAAAGVDPEPVVAAVGGNPFYLTEVLAAPGVEVPPSVRHAVLARVASVPPACRAALEQLAVVPTEVEPGLVAALVPDPAVLAPAERRGMLVAGHGRVRFGHELTRRAIELSVPHSLRARLHARVLGALVAAGADASRVVHHAVAAGDESAIARHASAAARDAATAGGQREAAAFALLALRRPELLDQHEAAGLHGLAASALRALNRFGEATRHAERAVRLWDEAGAAPVELGEALLVLARLRTVMADPDAARVAALRARDVLEPLGPSRALALCYCALGGQDALTARNEAALTWSERALAVARRVGSAEAVARALGSRGIARVAIGHESGLADLERAVEAAESSRQGDCLAVAAYNVSVAFLRAGRPDRCEPYLRLAQRVAGEHDLDHVQFSVEAHWCHLLLWRGEWDQAQRRLRALLDRADDPGANLALPSALLGRLLARRGIDAASTLIDRAWRTAVATGERQRLAMAGGARIEAAWLAGDERAVRSVGAELLTASAGDGHQVFRGEVLRYLRRAGVEVEPFPGCPAPFAAGITGDWAEAAKLWAEAGNPYEEALELTEAPDQAAVLQGLHTLDSLGAVPAAALVRRRLRRDGVRRVPRGPSAATRANPGGLTNRQLEVLRLLAASRTNGEIAERLHVSRRTVDNHVAALLDRLGTRSRRAAAAKAAELGLLHERRGGLIVESDT
jgi:DNA-binding CsgD family transcriptional regulator/tetratricopeptide (TPR) repeat protein